MSYYGEYANPLSRVTNVQVPVISGYITSRLFSADPIQPATSGEDTTMKVIFENVGDRQAYVALRQTNDHSVSGTRLDVISGVSLVPGGRSTKTTTAAYMKYVELSCTDGGPTVIRMQITASRRFEQMGFGKEGDATFYPKVLWQAKPIPVAASV